MSAASFNLPAFNPTWPAGSSPTAGVDPARLESLVLYKDGHAHELSDAALGAGELLGGFYAPASRALKFFPRFLRDGVYRIIARNRYRWFWPAG